MRRSVSNLKVAVYGGSDESGVFVYGGIPHGSFAIVGDRAAGWIDGIARIGSDDPIGCRWGTATYDAGKLFDLVQHGSATMQTDDGQDLANPLVLEEITKREMPGYGKLWKGRV